MARRLASYVNVTDPETGAAATFGPDDEVPEWAEKVITNPKAWAADEPSPEVSLETSVEYQPETEPGASREAEDNLAAGGQPDGDEAPEPAQDYEAMTVTDLRSEIRSRNEDGRDDDAKMPTDGVKADLIAALEADDQRAGA